MIFALGRSRITVSYWPEVGPVPAAPGRRATGNGPVVNCGAWPAPTCGATIGWPLFQLVSVLQSPLESFHQTAGTSVSRTNSMSPCETSPSTSLSIAGDAVPNGASPLLYCQKCQGWLLP